MDLLEQLDPRVRRVGQRGQVRVRDRSKRIHRGKIVTIKVPALTYFVDIKVLRGKPRIEGLAGMPSSAEISQALGP
jgi:hypothetical protein